MIWYLLTNIFFMTNLNFFLTFFTLCKVGWKLLILKFSIASHMISYCLHSKLAKLNYFEICKLFTLFSYRRSLQMLLKPTFFQRTDLNNHLISHLCTLIQIFFQSVSFFFKPLSNKIVTPKTKRLIYFQHIRPTQDLKSDMTEMVKLLGILIDRKLNKLEQSCLASLQKTVLVLIISCGNSRHQTYY